MSAKTWVIILCISLFSFQFCYSDELPPPSMAKVRMLYNSLDQNSIIQHLALHSLYPSTQPGKQALQDALLLMRIPPMTLIHDQNPLHTPINAIHNLVQLFSLSATIQPSVLSATDVEWVSKAAQKLPNRNLKGFKAISEADIIELPKHEIDLSRAIFLTQLSTDPDALQKMRSYEAMLDLMALQILARIPENATPKQKIREINRLVFEEMQFRFPPHSVYAKDIDLYTFLPSVLDSRRGVCLGVSILYLCLAQRLSLTLEMITPPGHIYVRYHQGDEVINIETTARGVHVDSKEYLGVNTRSLEERNLKEVIGLAFMNQAAMFWQAEQYEKALAAYLQAGHYLPNNAQLKEFTAYIHLSLGQEQAARELLEEIKDVFPEHDVSKNTIPIDFLSGKVNADGIQAVFKHVDETRESLLAKKDVLQRILEKYPQFRSGYQLLGITWIQLHRAGEALAVLQQYHLLDPTDVTIEYYLAALLTERWDYQQAWIHLRNAEALAAKRDHHPEALDELRKHLQRKCPDCE